MVGWRALWAALMLWTAAVSGASAVCAAPRAELWPYWQQHNPANWRRIDHTRWDSFLRRYLVTDDSSGIHRVRYAAVSLQDRALLKQYLADLAEVKVTHLDRPEQRAFWINLYNALTVKVILDHYPVTSIRDIDISPGLFQRGPWDAKLIRIEDLHLSLNDIEHRILRPIWRDARLHYALNCASLGCPNLATEPFSATNSEQLLEQAASTFINHQRGVRFDAGRLELSSIYKWYEDDFGTSRAELINHLRRYARPDLANSLKDYRGRIVYRYDWQLNAP